MRRNLASVAAALLVGSALPGASTAGSYLPPPGDALPVWSPDGTRIAFATSRAGHAVVALASVGGGETRLVEGVTAYDAAISPDWRSIAFTRFASPGDGLRIVGLDGTGERQLAAYGSQPVWSPDSRSIAFRASDESLSVVEVDGGATTLIAPGGGSWAWSPDGTRIAFGGGSGQEPDVFLADASGANLRLLTRGPGADMEPKWSPDGTRIAFLTQTEVGKPFRFGVIQPDGTGLVTYPGPRVSNSLSFAWLPGSDGIVFARDFSQGLFLLDLRSGSTTRLTAFGATPSPSPDGENVAFAAGGECRDRYGIYVARSDGTRVRRLTNDCRVLGTPGDDVIRGTGLADVLLGLRGDDRIAGLSAGYVGDTLRGGDGDDILVGTFSGDLLRGGAGRDRLFGGLSADVLYGGSGADRIAAQAGRDFVHARDGVRDVVVCGTNRGGTPERDEVWADRIDQVARDCEIVHRRGR